MPAFGEAAQHVARYPQAEFDVAVHAAVKYWFVLHVAHALQGVFPVSENELPATHGTWFELRGKR